MFGRRGGAAERRGTPADLLVVGLANPGGEYAGTRHNVGGEVVELLAERHGAKLRKGKERAMVDEVNVGGRRLALAIPLTYMNLSGEAVAPLVRRHGIDDPHHLVIVHDELDLPVGRFKLKLGGDWPATTASSRSASTSTPTTSPASASGSASPTTRPRAPTTCSRSPARATAASSTSSCRRRPTLWR